MSEIKRYYFKRGKANEIKTNFNGDAIGNVGCVEYWSGCDFDVIEDMLSHVEPTYRPTKRTTKTTNGTNYNN